MEILVAVVLGAFVGWIASIIVGKNDEQGWVGNIIVGIVGSFLGGLISKLLLGRDYAELGTFSWEAVFWSILGAVLLLVIVNALRGARNPSNRV